MTQLATLATLLADLVNTLNVENSPQQLDGYLNHLSEFNARLASFGLPTFEVVGEAD